MKFLKYIIILFFIYSSVYSFPKDQVMEVGEELVYTAYYGFIKLGEVHFKVTSYDSKNKKYYATAELRSNKSIPLVDINYWFETTMIYKGDSLFSYRFYSTEFKDKDISHIDYTFDYENGVIKAKKDINLIPEEEKEIKIDNYKKYQDGLSLFYNARIQSLSNKNYIVPVYINEKESTVNYSFNLNRDAVSGDMVDYDMEAIKVAGTAHFVGVFGLTGEFIGWMSNDEFRVPLKAKFNVSIGSITLELHSYKKQNWKPPLFKK
jgi:hypothetical protein